jgi:hypothetical protein
MTIIPPPPNESKPEDPFTCPVGVIHKGCRKSNRRSVGVQKGSS